MTTLTLSSELVSYHVSSKNDILLEPSTYVVDICGVKC